MAYVTEKRGVIYAVIKEGRNPVSGRERPVAPIRRSCRRREGRERLTERRARQRHTGSSLTLAESR